MHQYFLTITKTITLGLVILSLGLTSCEKSTLLNDVEDTTNLTQSANQKIISNADQSNLNSSAPYSNIESIDLFCEPDVPFVISPVFESGQLSFEYIANTGFEDDKNLLPTSIIWNITDPNSVIGSTGTGNQIDMNYNVGLQYTLDLTVAYSNGKTGNADFCFYVSAGPIFYNAAATTYKPRFQLCGGAELSTGCDDLKGGTATVLVLP